MRLILLAFALLLPCWGTFVTQGSMGTGNSKASGTTVTVASTSQTANAGDLVVVLIASDNTDTTDLETTHWTVTDSAGGNTYTRAKEFVNGQGSAAAGVEVGVYYSRLATQLASTGVITGTRDGAVTAKAIRAWRFTVGDTVSVQGSGTLAGDANDPGSMTISGLTSAEYLFLRAGGLESDLGTVTVTTNYTAIARNGTTGGGEASNISVWGEFRIVTATTETSNPTVRTVDNVNVFVAFQEAAGGAPTVRSLTTLGVGR